MQILQMVTKVFVRRPDWDMNAARRGALDRGEKLATSFFAERSEPDEERGVQIKVSAGQSDQLTQTRYE